MSGVSLTMKFIKGYFPFNSVSDALNLFSASLISAIAACACFTVLGMDLFLVITFVLSGKTNRLRKE